MAGIVEYLLTLCSVSFGMGVVLHTYGEISINKILSNMGYVRNKEKRNWPEFVLTLLCPGLNAISGCKYFFKSFDDLIDEGIKEGKYVPERISVEKRYVEKTAKKPHFGRKSDDGLVGKSRKELLLSDKKELLWKQREELLRGLTQSDEKVNKINRKK